MFKLRQSQAVCERHTIVSAQLGRTVKIDLYLPPQIEKLGHVDLLFINDGQDLEKMIFNQVFQSVAISNSLVAVGLHAGPERRREYGVANRPDYLNRGDKAGAYHQFMLSEVFSFIDQILPGRTIGNRWLAGFSLGGLCAFDLMMDHPELFHAVGVFSGSFWWRSRSLEDNYDEERDRIMHSKIREKKYQPQLRFFLEAGRLDENADRNNNGIIDSIDDTLGIINELERLGYSRSNAIHYLELENGKHDIDTWARVMPQFIEWLILPKMQPADSPI